MMLQKQIFSIYYYIFQVIIPDLLLKLSQIHNIHHTEYSDINWEYWSMA